MTDNKEVRPTDRSIINEIGNTKTLWLEFIEFLKEQYDHIPIVKKEGKDKSWTIRYRKSGKTLVTLYPRKNEFIVLIVLGKDEVNKTREIKLNATIKMVFESAKQYHDGRWLWIRPKTKSDLESIKSILFIKKKPKGGKMRIIAKCGYRCDLCPGFLQNVKTDNDRQKCSDGWFKYVGDKVPPETIHCKGCLDPIEKADSKCPVRPCVIQKDIENCGYCDDFPCEKLNTRMLYFNRRLGDLTKIPKEDYEVFIKPYISKDLLSDINRKMKAKKKLH